MDIFLIDDIQSYSYKELLNSLNTANFYYPIYKEKNIYLYFLNFILALVNNKSLILLDSDINATEIIGIDKEQINVSKALIPHTFSSIDDVVIALKKSISKITIFTSGTTGQPKKVLHSVSTLTRNVRIGDKYTKHIWAFAYNPTHMAGLQVFFQAFENLNTLVNVFNKQRNEIYDCVGKYAITHISATPTFYRLLLPFEKEYKSIIRLTLGGEKSDSNLYKRLNKIFPNAKINNVYASTEAGTLFAAKGEYFQIPEQIKDKFLVKKNELLIHKSLLGFSDSFNFEGEYYHSGDLIEWIDETKRLFKFSSRKNELINVGGYKVNPSEIESTLLSFDGIKQVLVYGKPNSVLGNIICADIVLENDCQLTEIEIKKSLRLLHQDFKVPRIIKFVNDLPLTRTGKQKRI